MEDVRKVIDCRWFPSDTKCTLAISGTEEEVIKAAAEHAIHFHGEKDTPQLRKDIRRMLRDAKE
jgi:hypothetical protein